jgi:SAM-dependent methyltransferase
MKANHYNLLDLHYISRKQLDHKIKKFAVELRGDLLDVGCGTKPYKHYFNVTKYIGLEISGSDRLTDFSDAEYDGTEFPFLNNKFDSVVCFQVLEHAEDISQLLSEIRRVLKPGGTALFTMPFIWPEHEMPYDFSRLTSIGLKKMINSHGFDITTYQKSTSGFKALLALYLNGLSDFSLFNKKLLRVLIKFAIVMPLNILSNIMREETDADALFLDHVLICRLSK